jgi:ATP-dependent Lhr-like helicase
MTDQPTEQNPFHRFAPFVQEFIYRMGWQELRAVQVAAAEALFDTPNHVLIMSGTASGKTEAAMLPILTDLYNRPSQTIGVLYIGPLKALINDQFERLQALLAESRIPVQGWHGDVDAGRKLALINNPRGVLQITPESLEAMLMRRHAALPGLFGDLRYVVIDEVHAFMESDRGQQILCQLDRIGTIQAIKPRRVGLSATLGDPEGAAAWLAGKTGVPVTIVNDPDGRRTIQIALWHFVAPPKEVAPHGDVPPGAADLTASDIEVDPLHDNAPAEDAAQAPATAGSATIGPAAETDAPDTQAMYEHMYAQTQGKKSIIFTNARSAAERVISGVRAVARQKGPAQADIYHVHHGNISAALRAAAEAAMQAPGQPACTSATLTLELGIDIGQLDQVLQLNATYSVSSFVQRLGRSGRRGGAARMLFYHEENARTEKTYPANHFPWALLQMIAIIQLYLEEKWIEPGTPPELPFSLLYHQTLSILAAQTELTPPQLARQVLTLPPFGHITQEQYQTLLRDMLVREHLQRMDDGKLIIGIAAEKMVNYHRFYATFADETAYIVRDGAREIGTIEAPPPVGSVFQLAGFTWQTRSIDEAHHVIKVERAVGQAVTVWLGSEGDIHDRIVARVRQVLTESTVYPYLQPTALERLAEARALAAKHKVGTDPITVMDSPDGAQLLFFPWVGSTLFRTIVLLLRAAGHRVASTRAPYYMQLPGLANPTEARDALRQIGTRPPALALLLDAVPEAALRRAKFDGVIPLSLLRQAYGADQLAYDAALALPYFQKQAGRSDTG